MNVVISSPLTIKSYGLFKSKPLPGQWGVLYDNGRGRDELPRIELLANKTASPLYVLLLEDPKFSDKSYCQNVTHFVLRLKKEKYHFQFNNVENKEDWVHSLCHVSSKLWEQRASAVNASNLDDNEDSQDSLSENMLYDSCEKVQQFKVSIKPTRASETNNLHGNYILNPTTSTLRLLDAVSFQCIHEWSYQHIRKYGRTRLIFKLEVGRRTTTGAGEFEFFSPDGNALTNLIATHMKQGLEDSSKQSQEELSLSCPTQKLDLHLQIDRVSLGSRNSSPRTPDSRYSCDDPFSYKNISFENREQSPEVKFSPYHSKDKHVSPVPTPRSFGPGVSEQDNPKPAPRGRKGSSGAEKHELPTKPQPEPCVTKQQAESNPVSDNRMDKHRCRGNQTKTPLNWASSVTVEGNIYDDPEDMQFIRSRSLQDYNSKADITACPQPGYSSGSVADNSVYSSPAVVKSDAWKFHASHESDQIHEEDYGRIKAFRPQPKFRTSPVSCAQVSHTSKSANDGNDVYDLLEGFNKKTNVTQENVYGMASAKPTLGSHYDDQRGAPPLEMSEYEISHRVQAGMKHAQIPASAAVCDDYEDTSISSLKSPYHAKSAEEEDYANFS